MMHHEGFGYRFERAIVRRPGRCVVDGLRAEDRGSPDHASYLEEHAVYVRALEQAGLDVVTLPALDDYPDSVFVEDTALVLPEGVIALNPGAPTRRGEALVMEADCRRLGLETHWLSGRGTLDGGDVLVTGREILIGLSTRSNPEGFIALDELLTAFGYTVRAVRTPPGVLHFKSDCSLLGPDTVLATRRLAETDCFTAYRVIEVPRGEEAAANCIRVNSVVFMPEGFPLTLDAVESAGFEVKVLSACQAALLDGGLSCQSLRF
ncbi:MAG: dimethylarginine dimethylaminohydrolase [Xanthomonadales bacterium]|nr:dimethylarginine dimethylaminohydrolase [Gammaproteobacteria bacterium]NNJ78292.1 dimethylarginine dimethylaminohydrolase [Xanthomonadales bacterium]NNL05080.1 dimethylarginine dimethylaminohydrolase [Xanthomonadales bacterium]